MLAVVAVLLLHSTPLKLASGYKHDGDESPGERHCRREKVVRGAGVLYRRGVVEQRGAGEYSQVPPERARGFLAWRPRCGPRGSFLASDKTELCWLIVEPAKDWRGAGLFHFRAAGGLRVGVYFCRPTNHSNFAATERVNAEVTWS